MRNFRNIAVWRARGIDPGAPRHPAAHRAAALLMLAAFTVRLAGMFPGVPVLHWHGHVAAVHAGGGYPHAYGPADASGVDGIPGREDAPACGGYFSPSCLPALAGDAAGLDDLLPLPAAGQTGPARFSAAIKGADQIQSRAPPTLRAGRPAAP